LARAIGAHRIAAEPEAVGRIVERCAGLPLALAIVAARAATHPEFPLAVLADQLSNEECGLDAFDGGDSASNARGVFSWSFRAITPAAEMLFWLVGCAPVPSLTTAAAASLAGLPLARVRLSLAELSQAQLLTQQIPGSFGCHSLLRDYALERARAVVGEAGLTVALRRLLNHYLHTGYHCALLLHPHRDPIPVEPGEPGVTVERVEDYAGALAWFTAGHHNLLAGIAAAADRGFDSHAWQLAWTMWTYLDRQGRWCDLVTVGRVGLHAADRADSTLGQALCHRILARANMQLCEPGKAQAHLRHALGLYQSMEDATGQAHTHNNLAVLSEARCDLAAALDHAQRALELYRATGHRRGVAHGLNTVGWYHTLLGNHARAITECGKALVELSALGDRVGAALTWDSLGHAHHHLGHDAQAVDCYRRAVATYVELGDRYAQASSLIRLGDAYQEGHEARTAWTDALSILDDLGHADAALARRRLGQSGAGGG